jgi:hypothetical protein
MFTAGAGLSPQMTSVSPSQSPGAKQTPEWAKFLGDALTGMGNPPVQQAQAVKLNPVQQGGVMGSLGQQQFMQQPQQQIDPRMLAEMLQNYGK